eukprot:scaffold260074_cov19-Prasinocladus_malaysianus.AAC.1
MSKFFRTRLEIWLPLVKRIINAVQLKGWLLSCIYFAFKLTSIILKVVRNIGDPQSVNFSLVDSEWPHLALLRFVLAWLIAHPCRHHHLRGVIVAASMPMYDARPADDIG